MNLNNVIHKRVAHTSELPNFSHFLIFQIDHSFSQQPQMERLTKEVRINLAIQAKKNNSKLSFKKLAFTYQIADATLRNRYNGKCARSDTIPNSRKLTPTEEKSIVERILDLDSRAFPVRLQHVEDMANLLLA